VARASEVAAVAAIKPIGSAIAAACALAGAGGAARAVEVDTALMVYSETDRVSAFEPVIQASYPLSDTRTFGLKFVLDALTGASPNGAVPSTQARIFTRPSGSSSYTAPPNTAPLDDAFADKRGELSLSLEQRRSLLTRVTYGLRGSLEQDYASGGVDMVLKREFDRRNRMLTLGLSLGLDSVRPSGGAPTAMAEMAALAEGQGDGEGEDGGEGGVGGGESKQTADLLVGLTQIVDRSTVVQFNYSASRASGYLNDPYKFVSVVESATGTAPGEPLRQLYEGRPDTRLKQSLYGRVKRHLGRDILDLSYRYLWDDWGLDSQTAELHYHLRAWQGLGLEPQLRWYRQSAADFYRHSLVDGEALPAFASADPRLAAFTAWTYGLKLRRPLGAGHELSLRAELYRQRGENHPADAIGQLRTQDLFPDLNAIVVELGYHFDFEM
jgi:hypothetical protein